MGQYYVAIILGPAPDGQQPREFIRTWVSSFSFGAGSKLMEHSYIGNQFTRTMEFLLSPEGPHWKSRVVWAGDYADPEPAEEGKDAENLYSLANEEQEGKMYDPRNLPSSAAKYGYVVNHTKRLAVDRDEALTDGYGYRIHPLPLLTAEGNGRGGGDYRGAHEDLVGSWARDVISMEREVPEGYELIEAEFAE